MKYHHRVNCISAMVNIPTFSIHYCKARQAVHKPTNTSDSCYQQFLCAQNCSNARMSWVISHYYSTAMPTACLSNQNLCARCCTNPQPNNNPCGRDKQSKGTLGDNKAITNNRISCDCKPVYVFH